jgi:hypothetical protein
MTFERAPCIMVQSYRSLIRVVGYFLYNYAGRIALRGQTRCYRTLLPSAHRGLGSAPAGLDGFLSRYRAAISVDTKAREAITTEPLLQHYGLRTRWMDFVDSVPHALFFACHRFVISSDSTPASPLHTFVPSLDSHGFIYIMSLGDIVPVRESSGSSVRGVWSNADGVLMCDLRQAKPSIALRPHAQHGLLVRPPDTQPDLWPRLIARIAVPTRAARSWIIGSEALSYEALFPPPPWDGIYGQLLSPRFRDFLERERGAGVDYGAISRYDFTRV